LNAMNVFAYSAARLEILRGAPEEKRRFLDRGVASIDPLYLEQLTRYTRVLKQRNALLHAISAGRESASQLDARDDQLEGGRPAQEVLSGGEQKMVVMFLKFAKLELFRRRFEEPAIFLLDDVDAELDLEILQELLVRLPSDTQVFATSAKERFVRALAAGP